MNARKVDRLRFELDETVALTFVRALRLAGSNLRVFHTPTIRTRRYRSSFVGCGRSGPAQIRTEVTATRRPKDTKLPHRPAVDQTPSPSLTIMVSPGQRSVRLIPLGIEPVVNHGNRVISMQNLGTDTDPLVGLLGQQLGLFRCEIMVVREDEHWIVRW